MASESEAKIFFAVAAFGRNTKFLQRAALKNPRVVAVLVF